MSGDGGSRPPFERYRALMEAHGFRPSRRFGQNFLLDPSLHRAIVDAADVRADDLVLEVGPGLGFLTRVLASRAARVVAVEIDPRLARILEGEIAEMPGGERVQLVVADVLGAGGVLADEVEEALRTARLDVGGRLLVVANLPYSVTGPFLAAMVSSRAGLPDGMTILVQLELAERLAARPGTSGFGGLSGLIQAGFDVRIDRRVGREVFRPRPKVDSAVVRLVARPDSGLAAMPAETRARFARFVRAAFASRRKTLRHGLARAGEALGASFVADAALLGLRPEQLSSDQLLEVFCAGRSDSSPERG